MSKPDIVIQLKDDEMEVRAYYKKEGKPVIQFFAFETLKIVDERGNLVLRR